MLALLPKADSSPEFARDVKPFLVKHCYSCHDAKKAKAGFRIDQLGSGFLAGKTADTWKEVIDQINSGAMPPKSEPRPDPKQSFAVVEWVGRELKRAEREARIAGGRNLLRRLNRDEYANTVVDLLSLDVGMTDTIRNLLPADGTADGFDRIAAALFLDQTQMESYLDVAKFIADRAIYEKPLATNKLVWEPQKWIGFFGDKHVQSDISKDIVLKAGVRDGENRKDGIVAWNSGSGRPEPDNDPEKFYQSGYGPQPDLTKTVTTDGYYRIRFPAGASRGNRGMPIRLKLTYARGSSIAAEHTIKEVQGTIDQPVMHEVLMFLRAPGPDQRVGLNWEWNAPKVIMTNPAHTAAWMGFMGAQGKLAKGRMDKADEATVAKLTQEREAAFQALANFDQVVFQVIPGKSIETAPKIFLSTFEIEGPIQEWPPKSHLAVGFKESDAPNEQAIRRMFSEFIPRAFRRPVDAEEVDAIVSNILHAQREFGLLPHETLRYGLQALLVAPGFLLIQEPQQEKAARPLDNYELANRLSYFLWNSMPDAELLQLAAAGRLTEPAIRRQQVERILKDPKIGRFVDSFAGQWLDVRRYGSVQPSEHYRGRLPPWGPRYDNELEVASRKEPLAFFQYVLDNNRPITDFINSDYLVINDRLATLYQIADVKGPEFRKVSIPAGVERGGVLGMSGLLTLLSDGNRTLPVRRAAWVREKLLNDPPAPPPPGAGEIQPNTAGANLTVRQRLELHRKEPTCASCHSTLDGYGMALENYDAIGAWSTAQDGLGRPHPHGRPLDVSGSLKSGRTFSTLKEYKQALLAERDRFGRAFVTTALTYALTRPVGVIDADAVDEIYKQLEKDEFRVHSVIHAIVGSRLFLTK
jgi:mono/diheme cytochrome c family protein